MPKSRRKIWLQDCILLIVIAFPATDSRAVPGQAEGRVELSFPELAVPRAQVLATDLAGLPAQTPLPAQVPLLITETPPSASDKPSALQGLLAHGPEAAQLERQSDPVALSASGEDNFLRSADLESTTATPSLFEEGTFRPPNELHPEDATPILKRSPGGIYFAVGTERGFIGAALSRRITGLVLVDVDPTVVRYNRINAALLQMAKDKKDYLYLRFTASADDWRRLAAERNVSKYNRRVLDEQENWRAWREAQRNHPLSPDQATSAKTFVGANYLADDALFSRLKQLADGMKIKAFNLDLADGKAMRTLASAVAASGESIGILDLSNVLRFVRYDRLGDILDSLKMAFHHKSILMMTSPHHLFENEHWKYFGFKLRGLLSENVKPGKILQNLDWIGYGLNPSSLYYRPNHVNKVKPRLWRRLLTHLSDRYHLRD